MAEPTGTARLINSVTSSTAGDGKYPYLSLPGSLNAKTVDELSDEKDSIYGTPWSELTDEEKSANPTVTEFLLWHSGKQVAYIKYLAEQTGNWDGEHTIGDDTDSIHIVLSDDGEKIYILEHLQKSDTGRIPLEDQKKIAGTDTWLNTVSLQLDMVPTGSASYEEAQNALLNDENDVSIYTLDLLINNPPTGYAGAPEFDKEPFQTQLGLLKTQIEGQAIFSATTIKEKLDDLQERVVRTQTFYDAAYGLNAQTGTLSNKDFGPQYDEDSDYVLGETDIDGYVMYRNDDGLYLIMDGDDYKNGNKTRDAFQDLKVDDLLVTDPAWGGIISLDDNAKIKEGYALFIEQERIIATVQKQRWQLAQTGNLNGRDLDAPTLIANIQMLTSMEKQARVAIDTEWIDQVQTFLQHLSVFQELLNATMEQADEDKPNKEFGLLGLEDRDLSGLTSEQMRAVAMFSSYLRGDAEHPVLTSMGLTLPELDLIEVHEEPTFETVDVFSGGVYIPATLTAVKDLPNKRKNELGFGDLEGDDYVTKVSYAPWNWLEQTKTKWDSVATRTSQLTQNVSKQLEIFQTDTSTRVKEQQRHFELGNSMMQMAMGVVGRISFLG